MDFQHRGHRGPQRCTEEIGPEFSAKIISCGLKVHSALGPGLLETALRLDLLVEEMAIVEVKAVERLLSIHERQLLTYMRLTEKRLGLLLNFNVEHFRNGIRRRVL